MLRASSIGVICLCLSNLGAPAFAGTGDTARHTPVLLGGISNTTSMSDPIAMRDVLASREIGLYIHPYAPNFTWGPERTKKITALFGHARTTEIELGWNFRRALTTVRLRNNGPHVASLPMNLAFSDNKGGRWDAVLPGARMLDGSTPCIDPVRYSYVIPAGMVCTIDVRSETIGSNAIQANMIRLVVAPAESLEVVGSEAVASHLGAGGTVGRPGTDKFGSTAFWTNPGLGGWVWYNSLGIKPTQASVNIENDTSLVAGDVADWVLQVKSARAAGLTSVAPVLQPSWWFHMHPGLANFATDPYMRNFRQMALDGGAVAIDAPSSWVRQVWGLSYLNYIETMIRWSEAKKIRFTWIVSPYGPKASSFMDDTLWILDKLNADHLRPTQWVVENYEYKSGNKCDAVGTANDTTKALVTIPCDGKTAAYTYRNSLNDVALTLVKASR